MASKLDTTPLTPDEARAIFKAAKTPRDRALVILLWRAGLRASEAVAARPDDLSPEGLGARLRVPCGKGKKPRTVGLDKKSVEVLEALRIPHGGTYLQTRTHRPADTSWCRRRIPTLAKTAGIRHRVHPHAFRHAFASELYGEGVGLREIQLLLGHERLDTTQVYLERLGCSEAVKLAAGREW